MRFIADGPSIPSDLITAHDEGRVILFCGSGVSRARAELPDFMGLAASVLDCIGSAPESRARQVKDAAEHAPKIDGLGALIAADTIFSQLEDEFPLDLIQRHVAQALYKPDVELAAHRVLLDLARGQDGQARLVTTNFDRLFEACDPALAAHVPPDLPDPSRSDLFRGIIHLHGLVTPGYDGAVCNGGSERGFVLSAADFGGAYLVHGWAARFIHKLIAKYQILFIGYSADDPPVRYLLEALGGSQTAGQRLYAFQEGDDDQARALWRRKGVEAICYNPADRHRALWDTLSAWANRARDPEEWHARLLGEAAAGPRAMAQFRRGHVAHLAATTEGARRLASAGAQLPAEWMCVFDPYCRYKPSLRSLFDDAATFEPFDCWSIDSDLAPEHKLDDQEGHKREAPKGAWCAFDVTDRDRHELDERSVPGFFGNAHQQSNLLPSRLTKLGKWFTKVAHEPWALWWASDKIGLHPEIAWEIKQQFSVDAERFPYPVRQAWETLLEVRAQQRSPYERLPLNDVAGTINRDGWSPMRVWQFAALQIPTRKISRGWHIAEPPETLEHWRQLFNCELDYAWFQGLPDVPEDHIPLYARALFHALEAAIDLERNFLGGDAELGPFTPVGDDDNGGAPLANLTGLYRRWLAAMERWAKLDAQAVRAFIAIVSGRGDSLAIRVRLWTCSQPELLSAAEIGQILSRFEGEAFWDRGHQRDLLHMLAMHWNTLDAEHRHRLEAQLLAGPARYDQEEEERFAQRNAWRTLERMTWLANQGCAFDFDRDVETRKRVALVPDWDSAHGQQADRSNESRAYSVKTDKDSTPLADVPPELIIERARELSGRHPPGWRTERAPFAGLADDQPEKALAALRCYTGATPVEFWSSLLWSDHRKSDPTDLVAEIAATLLDLDADALAAILDSVSFWFRNAHELLEAASPDLCARLWDRLLALMEAHPEQARSGLVHRREDRDWIGAALNAPAGRLTELTLLRSGPTSAEGQIDTIWLDRMERLLALPGDAGGHALVFLARNVDYLFARARAWTEAHLLPLSRCNDERRTIFWAGLFWSARGFSPALFAHVRDILLALVRERRSGREWNMSLALQIVLGWHDKVRQADGTAYSDAQLRSAILAGTDELRRQVLYTLRNCISKPGSEWIDPALHLITNIWPRQFSARSESVTAALVSLVLSSGDNFPRFVSASLDLLQPLGREAHWQVTPQQSAQIATAHPEPMLVLLTKILPDDPRQWPYGIDKVFSALSETDLGADARLVHLQKMLANSR